MIAQVYDGAAWVPADLSKARVKTDTAIMVPIYKPELYQSAEWNFTNDLEGWSEPTNYRCIDTTWDSNGYMKIVFEPSYYDYNGSVGGFAFPTGEVGDMTGVPLQATFRFQVTLIAAGSVGFRIELKTDVMDSSSSPVFEWETPAGGPGTSGFIDLAAPIWTPTAANYTSCPSILASASAKPNLSETTVYELLVDSVVCRRLDTGEIYTRKSQDLKTFKIYDGTAWVDYVPS